MTTLSRIKTWITGDVLTASDLNGEFNNIMNDHNGSIGSVNITSLTSTLTFNISTNVNGITISKSGSGAGSPISITNAGTAASINANQTSATKGIVLDQDGNQVALDIDSEQTTTTIVNISAAPLTTGSGIAISDLDALTSGSGLTMSSNSSSATSRTLLNIVNDNASATSATVATFKQDAPTTNLLLNSTASGGGASLSITSSATTSSAVADIVASALTTGGGFNVQCDALTTGRCGIFQSNSSSTSARVLTQITNDNTAATGTTCLGITNDADSSGAPNGGGDINIRNTHATFSQVNMLFRNTRAGSSSYHFITCQSDTGADTEARIRGDGEIFGDGAAYNTPADYAEMYESNDGGEIEPGFFVAYATRGLVCKTSSSNAVREIVGITSANPAVLGDAAWGRWSGKFLKDEFGAYLITDTGERQLNPSYDNNSIYVPRDERDEWCAIGLLGKLYVRTSEDITGDYVSYGDGGMAINGSRWRVLEVVRQKSDDPDGKGYGVVRVDYFRQNV